MNLYKVYSKNASFDFSNQFIVAEEPKKAIKKYLEITKSEVYHNDIQVEFICKRDDIIPTIEQIKELIDYKNLND